MDPLAAHPSPVPWQFHDLSLRGRVVVSQLPQAVTTFLLFLVLAVFQAPLLADPLVRWAGALTLVLTLACALVPWDRLPYRSYLVIPVLDFVPIGLLFEGLFPHVLGVPFMAALPVLWLVASVQLPPGAAPLGALLTIAMLWVPVLLRPGPVTFPARGSSPLIPLMMLAIGTMAQILTNSAEAKDAHLRRLLAAGARRERLLSTVLDSVDVGVLALDETGRPLLTNNRQLHAHAQRRLGHTTSAVPALPLYDGAGAPVPPGAAPITRAVAGGSSSADLVCVDESPVQQVLSVTARVMRDEHGRPEGSVLSFSDVTELVDALQAQDEFVAEISHELRTPLTSNRGYIELLAMNDRPTRDRAGRSGGDQVQHRPAAQHGRRPPQRSPGRRRSARGPGGPRGAARADRRGRPAARRARRHRHQGLGAGHPGGRRRPGAPAAGARQRLQRDQVLAGGQHECS